MIIGKHDPLTPGIVVERNPNGTARRTSVGLPIRVHIATHILSAMAIKGDIEQNDVIKALMLADRLVDAHNDTTK